MCELLQINRLKHDRKNYLRDINIADVSIANENTTNLVSSYAVRQVADKKGRCAGRIISASAALVIAATVGTTVASVSVTSIATTTASSSTITHFENRKNEQALLQKKMEVKTIVAMPLNSQIFPKCRSAVESSVSFSSKFTLKPNPPLLNPLLKPLASVLVT